MSSPGFAIPPPGGAHERRDRVSLAPAIGLVLCELLVIGLFLLPLHYPWYYARTDLVVIATWVETGSMVESDAAGPMRALNTTAYYVPTVQLLNGATNCSLYREAPQSSLDAARAALALCWPIGGTVSAHVSRRDPANCLVGSYEDMTAAPVTIQVLWLVALGLWLRCFACRERSRPALLYEPSSYGETYVPPSYGGQYVQPAGSQPAGSQQTESLLGD